MRRSGRIGSAIGSGSGRSSDARTHQHAARERGEISRAALAEDLRALWRVSEAHDQRSRLATDRAASLLDHVSEMWHHVVQRKRPVRHERPACPECGGALMIDPRATVIEEYAVSQHNRAHPILTREIRIPIASCTRCGWTVRIR